MAKVDFQVRTDGNGKERFFIDHRESNIDHYTAEYVKANGEMPVIPSHVRARRRAQIEKVKARIQAIRENYR